MKDQNETEIWKDVPGYEGLYQASTQGQIRSLDRSHHFKTRHNTLGFRKIKGRIIKQKFCRSNGYYHIALCCDGHIISRTVHSVIADTHVYREDGLNQVNHKDGIKTNNASENLEWTTSSGNRIHAFKSGLQKKTISLSKLRVGTLSFNHKLNDDKVREIRLLYKTRHKSLSGLAKMFSVSKSTILSIVSHKTWKHVIP